MTARKLTLRRDPLSVLADGDLEAVAAGGASAGPTCAGTCEVRCFDGALSPSLLTCPATRCTPCPL